MGVLLLSFWVAHSLDFIYLIEIGSLLLPDVYLQEKKKMKEN